MAEEQEAQPAGEATPAEDPLKALEERIEAERKLRETAEEKIKDLSSRLTREQQEKQELYRFHKATLPRINEVVGKSFNEDWEESPERAVVSRVEEKVSPIHEDLSRTKAELALIGARTSVKDFDDYFNEIVALGNKPHLAPLTWTREGLVSLYQMAKATKLEEELKTVKMNGQAETEKARAVTESSSPKEAPKKAVKLTPEEMRVASNLNIKPEEYIKYKGLQDG